MAMTEGVERDIVLDEMLEALRLELSACEDEKEAIRIRLGTGYQQHTNEQRFMKLCGRTQATAKCMEIVEAMRP